MVVSAVKPDARVQFPQTHAPTDDSLARAILLLADAIAKGDSDRMAPLLAADAKNDLDVLTASGEWDESVEQIEAVRVVMLEDLTPGGPGGGPGGSGEATAASLQLAIQEPSGAYLLGWTAIRTGDRWVFDGVRAPSEVRKRATDFDGGLAGDALAGLSAGAAGGDPMEQASVLAYLAMELQKRVAQAANIPFDPNAAKQQAAMMGVSASEIDSMLEKGRDAAKRGVVPEASMIKMLIDAMVMGSGGAITRDQVIQFVSNILSQPEKTIRDIAGSGGGMPAMPPGMPTRGLPGGG